MQIEILFFGLLKDITGLSRTSWQAPAGATLQDVFEHFAALYPRLRELASSVVMARNEEFAPPGTPLREGDEVAFLPPVSGGSGDEPCALEDPAGHYFALTRQPIDTRALIARLLRGEDGAVATFEGVVRNNSNGRPTRYLEYECYEGMALRQMAEIGRWLAASFPISRVGMIHRLGRLEIGEASVVVIITAPHRRPACEAVLEGINRLKRLVPIWKKEFFEDGELWVEGEWDESVKQR